MFQQALDFHPHKLYPRYAKLAAVAARTKPTFELFRATSPFTMDSTTSQSDKVDDRVLAGTAVAIIGFPRTGTTFLQFALADIAAGENSVYKNQNVRAIPFFSSRGTPVLVTLRNPLDTFISWSFYNNDKFTETPAISRLNTYLAWHRILRRKISYPRVHLVNFNDFTSTFEVLPEDVWSRLHFPVSTSGQNTILSRRELSEQQKSEGTELEAGNTTSSQRKSPTQDLRELYLSLEQTQIMKKCTSIYEELAAH